MTNRFATNVARRDVLCALTGAVGAAVANTAPLAPAQAASAENKLQNGRARYQASSLDVQNFYRVNRYPRT